jgi:histidine triad (HIT) family protein
MTDCLFCKLRDGGIPAQITHRDDEVIAFKDIKGQAPLHELVIPTRHISSLAAASEQDAALLGKLMLVGAQRAREHGYGERGFRVVMNAGPDAGQTVFHVHLHVLAGRPLGWPPG